MAHYSKTQIRLNKCVVKRCVAKNLVEINWGIFHAVFKVRGRGRASDTIDCNSIQIQIWHPSNTRLERYRNTKFLVVCPSNMWLVKYMKQCVD